METYDDVEGVVEPVRCAVEVCDGSLTLGTGKAALLAATHAAREAANLFESFQSAVLPRSSWPSAAPSRHSTRPGTNGSRRRRCGCKRSRWAATRAR